MFGYVETNHMETNDKFKFISINRVLKCSQVDSSSDVSFKIGNSKVHLLVLPPPR